MGLYSCDNRPRPCSELYCTPCETVGAFRALSPHKIHSIFVYSLTLLPRVLAIAATIFAGLKDTFGLHKEKKHPAAGWSY